MPRVETIKKARKDYPNDEIKKGDTYYKWSFNFGPTFKSLVYPTRSQLTRSDFLGQLYDMEDGLSTRFEGLDNESDIEAARDDLVGDIQNLLDETQERLEGMPEQLRETSQSGETLQERVDGLEGWVSDLESIDTSVDEDFDSEEVDEEDFDEGEDPKEAKQRIMDERSQGKEDRIQEIIDEILETSANL